jgi:hypothetical protein
MSSFENIAMLYKLEALEEDNPFTKKQRNELITIMDDVEKLKMTSSPIKAAQIIKKYKSLEKQYLDKYNSWGGKHERLNKKLRAFEDKSIPYFEEFKDKFNELKKKMRL